MNNFLEILDGIKRELHAFEKHDVDLNAAQWRSRCAWLAGALQGALQRRIDSDAGLFMAAAQIAFIVDYCRKEIEFDEFEETKKRLEMALEACDPDGSLRAAAMTGWLK